ncbi:methyltransferase domain-containing protein [Micromonospora sp. NPDC047738]|uniref:class I SAM-dependent methyltransferase n=1 Tax=Micromonospora sp. NPDC047738 TaxID=3155741 RepID=UPI0033FE3188
MSSEPTTDRIVLTTAAYACGQHLSARQALYRYQTPAYDLPAIVIENLATVTGTVADIGCGNGHYLRRLRTRRPDLTTIGIDIAVGILRQTPPPVAVADAAALPLQNESVDAVLAMHMLYHITDTEAGLAELTRILRPRGILVVSTNANNDKHELDDLWAAAAADVLGTPNGPRRISLSSRFPLDDAQDRLRPHVSDIHLIDLRGTITVTEPQPVLDHLASYRAWAHQTGVPFEATLHRVRERLTEAIDRDGTFLISGHGGILVCRR